MDSNKATPAAQGVQIDQPWHKLPEETDHEYITFQAYLRMPAPRSACALAKSTGLANRSLDRTRQKHAWVDRAAAYDSWRIQQAMNAAPIDVENPYERMLFQTAARAQALHEAANRLLGQATRHMDWAERKYHKELAESGAPADTLEPPKPSTNIISAIRGASDVMDRCAESQALALGIMDVLKLRSTDGAGGGQ